jgi:acyl-CoA synthetase (AMP-forming)/AMP-acid ligase II/acyl carrier protein
MRPDPDSIAGLIEMRGRETPDAPAIEAPGRAALSSGALAHMPGEVVARLNGLGLGRGDRVALVVPNGPEAATAFLAIAAGATCAPLNPDYVAGEVEFYLDDLGAKALVVASGEESPAIAVARRRGLPIIELVPESGAEAGLFSLAGAGGAGGAAAPGFAAPGFAEPGDAALVLHTSGTTARPKQVPLTHANLCVSARNVARTLSLNPEDRCLNILPLFHIHGLVAALLGSLTGGGSVICTPGFHAFDFFAWLDECRPSWTTAVPAMLRAILARAGDHRETISRAPLRFIRSSSAALPPPVAEGLEEAFGVPVIEAYGMTEAAHQIASNPLPPGERKPGSVGPAAGPEVAIMADDGRLLPAGQPGEIVIRGASVMGGYENDGQANVEAFANGWFRTGDQGAIDGDGYLTVTGRLKEIINRGGEKIAPREVDEVLLGHPAVAEAVTFAVPDTSLGEEVGAAVVVREGAAVEPREIKAFAAERLAFFKVPRHLVIVAEIPKGPTGKPHRIGLAERLGLGGPPGGLPPVVDSTPPRTEVEEALAALWREILHVEAVGVHAPFLELGGDSILAAQLVARVRETMEVDVALMDVFDTPTVADMAEMVEDRLGAGASRPPPAIPRRREGGPAPVSFVQEWRLNQDRMWPDWPLSNRPSSVHLIGPLDVAVLQRSFDEIVRRHESLRTTFRSDDGKWVQLVVPPSSATIPFVDLTALPSDQRHEKVLRLALAEIPEPINPGRWPLFRTKLVRLDDNEHVLILTIHHLVFDGWSMTVLVRELGALYEAFSRGRRSPLPELPIQYADFAVWQRNTLRGPALEKLTTYWKERLCDDLRPPRLPTDGPRPEIPSFRVAVETRTMPPSLWRSVKALSRHRGATPFMTCLAAFQTLLRSYTGTDDIAVGCTVTGRSWAETEPLIGLFYNILVLRTDLSGDPTFSDLLSRVRDVALAAFAHQDLPFSQLLKLLRPDPYSYPTPFASVLFELRNFPEAAAEAGVLRIAEFPYNSGIARFDMSWDLVERAGGLTIPVIFNVDLFERATVARIIEDFVTVLDCFTSNPDNRLSTLPRLKALDGKREKAP